MNKIKSYEIIKSLNEVKLDFYIFFIYTLIGWKSCIGGLLSLAHPAFYLSSWLHWRSLGVQLLSARLFNPQAIIWLEGF
jgi:hypothetical protein